MEHSKPLDEFTRARLERVAASTPPWESKPVIDEDADHEGAIYIASAGLLDTLVCYTATSQDGLLIGSLLGAGCIATLVWFGRYVLREART